VLIRFDSRRAGLVFDPLLDAYGRKAYPFDRPDAIVPQGNGNVPHEITTAIGRALYLFHACFWMRGGILSDKGMELARDLFRSYPELFDPAQAARQDPADITAILHENGLSYKAEEIGRFWVTNDRRLLDRYQGNPLLIFRGVRNFAQAVTRIKNNRSGQGFLGFKEKMVSMLTYFYAEAGLIRPFLFPPPVDFHALRIVFGHELAVPDDYSAMLYREETLAGVRKMLSNYCRRRRVDPIHLSEAMWLLSRTLCAEYPGNGAWDIERPKQGRRTAICPRPIVWTSAMRARFDRTCAQCPIARTCRRCVPASHYYICGRIHAVRSHEPPPQQELQFPAPDAPPRRD